MKNLLGTMMRNSRKEQGMTQTTLAKKCMVSVTYINILEKGVCKFSQPRADYIFGVLNTKIPLENMGVAK